MKIAKNKLFIIVISLLFCHVTLAANKFYDDRNRGWLWFEEKEKEDPEYTQMTPEQAINFMKAYKKRLKGLRYVLFANPTSENLRNYIVFENKMWERVAKLDSTIRLARYKYPELYDTLKEPTNVQAVKLKRTLDKEEMQNNIKSFASKFDLIIFTKESCPYCKNFEPIVDSFAKVYSFKVEAVSLDGSKSQIFKSTYVPGLAERLSINSSPTLVAISKNGERAFEIVRGMVSISELEEFVSLAQQFVKQNHKNKD